MGEQCSVGGYFFWRGKTFAGGGRVSYRIFLLGWGRGTFSDSTDIVQNFYREKKEPKNVIN